MMFLGSEVNGRWRAYCFLPVRKEVIQLSAVPWIPMLYSLAASMWCDTVSNTTEV